MAGVRSRAYERSRSNAIEEATMRTYEGGASVKSGFYWDLGAWSLTTRSGNGGILPGGPDRRYVKVPVPVVLLLAPVMGGLYVMFLPFIGFAMVFAYAVRGAALGLTRALGALSATVAPSWAPAEGRYVSGHHEEPVVKDEAATPEPGRKA
jgi:hypothetical protein